MKSFKQYTEEINTYVCHFYALKELWEKNSSIHREYNKELLVIFDEVEKSKNLTVNKLENYLQIRSENDAINSELKLLSTATNAMWIRIQNTYASLLLHHGNELIIKFESADRVNGRLNFIIERKIKK